MASRQFPTTPIQQRPSFTLRSNSPGTLHSRAPASASTLNGGQAFRSATPRHSYASLRNAASSVGTSAGSSGSNTPSVQQRPPREFFSYQEYANNFADLRHLMNNSDVPPDAIGIYQDVQGRLERYDRTKMEFDPYQTKKEEFDSTMAECDATIAAATERKNMAWDQWITGYKVEYEGKASQLDYQGKDLLRQVPALSRALAPDELADEYMSHPPSEIIRPDNWSVNMESSASAPPSRHWRQVIASGTLAEIREVQEIENQTQLMNFPKHVLDTKLWELHQAHIESNTYFVDAHRNKGREPPTTIITSTRNIKEARDLLIEYLLIPEY